MFGCNVAASAAEMSLFPQFVLRQLNCFKQIFHQSAKGLKHVNGTAHMEPSFSLIFIRKNE